MKQSQIMIKTPGRGFVDITEAIKKHVHAAAITTGLCHLFLHHTSASLILCENADPKVRSDLAAFMQRLVPDNDALYQHIVEGEDDMAAHVRTILTNSFLTLPITNKQLALGTWQGIYIWEHRLHSHQRTLTITMYGDR